MATSYTAYSAIPQAIVFGNKRIAFGTITINGVSGTTSCGLNAVDFALVTPQTITSGYHHQLSSNMVQIFSATSADKFNVMAVGR